MIVLRDFFSSYPNFIELTITPCSKDATSKHFCLSNGLSLLKWNFNCLLRDLNQLFPIRKFEILELEIIFHEEVQSQPTDKILLYMGLDMENITLSKFDGLFYCFKQTLYEQLKKNYTKISASLEILDLNYS